MSALAPVAAQAPPVEKAGGNGKAPNADPAVMRAGLGTALLFLGPYLVLFVMFVLGPILYGLWISLHQWDFLLPGKPFVGLKNYADLFTGGSTTAGPFWNSMRATGIFTLLSVPLLMVLPLALAVALNKKFWGRNAVRAIFFAPYVLGVAVIGLLWRYLLDPNVGVLNYYLDQIGIDRIPFTTATPWVWLALVVPTIWWTAGYNMVIFLAGLQEISPDLYEAAELDGASAWQRFRHVTLPGLRPVTIFVLTITILASANVFGQSYLITQGQPGEETRTVIMQIGEEGLRQFNMGAASAMSTILTLALLLISVLSLSFMRERTPKESKA
ncbi:MULTISPECIES: carbohydrate ABC transporter permease [unclassified Knoellia]|uniref:carbohydrate ABC transporter permease n=1 Tax=Knoellia altitudinis TaxID=3404795 RepID=UPI0036220E79